MDASCHTNKELLKRIIVYLEEHLSEECDLASISQQFGYSKYHLHRLFSMNSGYTIHDYVIRRRLSEAARKLYETEATILAIALEAGYETQRSFHKAFVKLYHTTPKSYRQKHDFHPLQLPLQLSPTPSTLQPAHMQSIAIIEQDALYLAGYQGDTRHGFAIIGRLWHKLHKHKHLLTQRCHPEYLTSIHDYALPFTPDQPCFVYHVGAQITKDADIPKGMQRRTLPASSYVMFQYRGRNEESIQPVIEYIYQVWFPQSSCILNDQACYDIVNYGEEQDAQGLSQIEVWIPILKK